MGSNFCRSDYLQHLSYVLPAAAILFWLLAFPIEIALLQPDSNSYLSFVPFRAAGYPLFLDLVEWLSGSAANVIYVQLLLFTAAVLALGFATQKSTGSRLLAAIVVVAIGANPELNKYHFTILSESLFISATIAISALMILAVHAYRPLWVWSLSFIIGAAIAFRPAGYAFVPLLPLLGLVVFYRQAIRPGKFLIAAAVPLIAIIAFEQLARTAAHGDNRQNMLWWQLLGKAGMVESSAANPYSPTHPLHDLWRRLDEDLVPVRKVIREAPGFGAAQYILANYEVFVEVEYAHEEIASAAKAMSISTFDVMKQIATKRLMQALGDYLGLVWQHYRGLWTPFGHYYPPSSAALSNYLESRRPLPLITANHQLNRTVAARRIAWVAQPLFLLCWAITIIVPLIAGGLIAARAELPANLACAGLFSLMINGNFLLTALFGVGISRYTLVMWPAIVLACLFAIAAACQYYRPRLGRRT